MSLKETLDKKLKDFNTGAYTAFEALPLAFEKATGYKIDRISGRDIENDLVYKAGVVAGSAAYAAGLALSWPAIVFQTLVINATNFAHTHYITLPNKIRRQKYLQDEEKFKERVQEINDNNRLNELSSRTPEDYITDQHSAGDNNTPVLNVDFIRFQQERDEKKKLLKKSLEKTYKSPSV